MVWQEFTSDDGRKYYYNSKTKETTWEKPEDYVEPSHITDELGETKDTVSDVQSDLFAFMNFDDATDEELEYYKLLDRLVLILSDYST